LPQKYRETVMELAHDIPASGHLGNKKTHERVLQYFFWPGIFTDVANYCRSCGECQKTGSKGRVVNLHIPPMVEPFCRVAADVVGPLSLTECKNRYILVACDYASIIY